uniref:Ig-like domain-containing protein n=1 Tax=Electrophorus electricus TaxID=8005 RepID=A0A4W4DX02_ELEEL
MQSAIKISINIWKYTSKQSTVLSTNDMTKYFCKGESTACANQIKTGAKHTWVHEGRVSLYDNTSAKVFWVVMRSLTVEDSGTYQCGVDIERWIDVYIPTVEMKVKAGEFSSLLLFFIILPLPTLFITLLNYLLSTIQNIKHELTDSQFMITQVWDSSVYLSKLCVVRLDVVGPLMCSSISSDLGVKIEQGVNVE